MTRSYDALVHLRGRRPARCLLGTDNAALVLSFLGRVLREVRDEVRLAGIESRRLRFDARVSDDAAVICRGTHARGVIVTELSSDRAAAPRPSRAG